jgi:asparagine synthase (glutamine-hydrolysing)
MFAFALWDRTRSRLVIGRDRVGKKPLHYAHAADGSLSFASELTALMKDDSIPRDIDPSSLDAYLAFGYIGAPDSIWRAVRKLPPGHVLTWEDGRCSVERYWRLDYATKTDASPAEIEAGIRDRIAKAVRRRMIADVTLGAFLSGGIDSSIVVREMAAASTEPVRTFSIGFEHEDYNELPNARLVAEQFGTEHTELIVRPDAVELLPSLVSHYGEPYADSSAIPSFYLAEMTAANVTVALNGDGGDESFAGYLRHPANALTRWIDLLPVRPRAAVARMAAQALDSRERRSARVYARRYLTTLGLDAADRYAAHVGIFDAAERRSVLSADVLGAVDPARTAGVIRGPLASATGRSRLDALLQVDVETYLPGDLLPKVDIATMAHSLEARSPFLDHELMEYAASIPARYKARGMQKKWILRRAYRDLLPGQILDGPKRGFGVPIGDWFRGDLRGLVEDTLMTPDVGGGLLDPAGVHRIVEHHLDGRGDRSFHVWALLFLETWRVGVAGI